MKKLDVKKKQKKVTLNDVASSVKEVAESVDALARITTKGFENTVSKAEFGEFKQDMEDFKKKTDKSLFELQSDMGDVKLRVKNVEQTLGPVLSMTEALKLNWRDHESRLSRLERKAGLEKSQA